MKFRASPGKSYPLGSTVSTTGVNFVVYSKRADYLELLLFDNEESRSPSSSYRLDPQKNFTGNYWHIFLEGCQSGQVYAWRAHGPFKPEEGLKFDSTKVLVDPYSRAIVGWAQYSRDAAGAAGDNCDRCLKSVALDTSQYDWGDDCSPAISYADSVIYELHVGGFTLNPNSGVAPEKRGTFAGVIEKIPYLKSLGITSVELMPVHAFDKSDAPPGLTNYWGYSPLGFFAPHFEYSSQKTALGAVNEFKDMVKALHQNGMEVILDVVFNHSSENGEDGPILSLKGLDNLTYYTLDEEDFSYKNYSGCGNTLRSEHPIVTELILDSLRYWVSEMHVDGFRFDLASVLSRDLFGKPAERPPVLWAIESDPMLASCKLIAEAWDPAGLYQVGWFVRLSNRFAEWNGPFRDDIRRFARGDSNTVYTLSQRLSGSQDIYGSGNWDRHRSINFITCHDGFTLNDLVSYNQKHNQANLENNRDGQNENFSWNCGVVGETEDHEIEALRLKLLKNMLTLLFLSPGTPMILMGDEFRRTTGGNNNSYCQNNELNWLDWDKKESNEGLFSFCKNLISLRRKLKLYKYSYLWQENRDLSEPEFSLDAPTVLRFHGVALNKPDFYPQSHSLALELKNTMSNEHVYAAFNSYWEPLQFELPAAEPDDQWLKVIDTSYSSWDEDILQEIDKPNLSVKDRSAVVLVNKKTIKATQPDTDVMASTNRMINMKITWTYPKQ